ncbi:hypothetical protein [Nocardioides stalactiti]|uniref:hypothetical protein n=1 Tax=Nocardioides stalactiti TaxID=2755356 RepID=UPI0015FF6D99|nr:hypothetical protein [Nocardioides stalactiti]
MSVVRKSISLDERVAEQIDAAAREDGMTFSRWLSAALEEQLILRDGRRAMAEWAERQPLPEEAREWARKELDRALGEG